MTMEGSMDRSQNVEQIRVLSLNKGEHQDGTLYRLKKG